MADDQPQPKPKDPKAHKMYEISGDSIKPKRRNCPKCGKGTFLAQHKDRITCGKCNYTEFITKSDKDKEQKKEK